MPVRRLVLMGVGILSIGTALALASLPTGQPTDPAKVAPPGRDLYDESADAKAQVAAALAKAKSENRRVLIQWGFENCSWCHLLHDLCTTDKSIKQKLSYEYDVVYVDIGAGDKNMGLAADYGADLKTHGVPFLTVLDADGKPLANQETSSLETQEKARPGHDPALVKSFLTEHQAPYLAAESVLNDALSRAKADGKKVFVHVGAPWCGWCHKLDDWMARKEVAAILDRSFVAVKIDQDRMTGAKQVFERYNLSGEGGIPWMVFVNGDGQALVTSDGPEGNIGFPAKDEEVAYFARMLAQAGVGDADIQALTATLRDGK